MSLFLLFTFIFPGLIWLWVNTYRYIFSGMNIHLPAILGFTRYQGFDPSPYCIRKSTRAPSARTPSGVSRPLPNTTDANHSTSSPPRKKSVTLVARHSHGWDGGWKFRVFDGFLSIFLYFGLVAGNHAFEPSQFFPSNSKVAWVCRWENPLGQVKTFVFSTWMWLLGRIQGRGGSRSYLGCQFQGDYTKGKIEYLYNLYSKPDAYAYT